MPTIKILAIAMLLGLATAVPNPAPAVWKTTSTTTSKRTTSTTTTSKTTSTSSTSHKTTSTSSSSSSTKISSSTSSTTKTSACSTSTSAYQSFYVNYNFENVGNGDIDPAAIEPIGEADLLNFINMALVDETLEDTLGVLPATPPNCAAFSSAISLEESLADAPAQISAAYTESSIDHFTALQWFYGCVIASEENELSLPISCTISAVGYNKAGTLVAEQDFEFVVDGSLTQDMTFATFDSSFVDLYYINLTVTNNLTVAALFDNFIAELYQLPASVFYPSS